MRKLTKKQKELLDKQNCLFVDQVPGLFEKLEKLNDYETLTQDADRYLGDNKWKSRDGAIMCGWSRI